MQKNAQVRNNQNITVFLKALCLRHILHAFKGQEVDSISSPHLKWRTYAAEERYFQQLG